MRHLLTEPDEIRSQMRKDSLIDLLVRLERGADSNHRLAIVLDSIESYAEDITDGLSFCRGAEEGLGEFVVIRRDVKILIKILIPSLDFSRDAETLGEPVKSSLPCHFERFV